MPAYIVRYIPFVFYFDPKYIHIYVYIYTRATQNPKWNMYMRDTQNPKYMSAGICTHTQNPISTFAWTK